MSTLGLIRRFGLTLAVAGIAVVGGVAVAPAASAAPADSPRWVVDQEGNRVKAPFFCDPDNPRKQHPICIVPGGPRF